MVQMMPVQIMLRLLFDRFPNMKLADRDAVVWSDFGFREPVEPAYAFEMENGGEFSPPFCVHQLAF